MKNLSNVVTIVFFASIIGLISAIVLNSELFGILSAVSLFASIGVNWFIPKTAKS